MHITAEELKKLGVIEKIIPEYAGEDALEKSAKYLKGEIMNFLEDMGKKTPEKIVEERYDRFRQF